VREEDRNGENKKKKGRKKFLLRGTGRGSSLERAGKGITRSKKKTKTAFGED